MISHIIALLLQGKTLRCSLYTKNRLYIHKIPKSWSADQFQKMIHEVGPGAEIIDLKQVTVYSAIYSIAEWLGLLLFQLCSLLFLHDRMLQHLVATVALLSFLITIMPVLIMLDKKCPMEVLSWKGTTHLYHGHINKLIFLQLLR